MSTEPRRSSESIRLKNLMDAARDAREMWERGEISREEYHDALNELRSPKRSFPPILSGLSVQMLRLLTIASFVLLGTGVSHVFFMNNASWQNIVLLVLGAIGSFSVCVEWIRRCEQT